MVAGFPRDPAAHRGDTDHPPARAGYTRLHQQEAETPEDERQVPTHGYTSYTQLHQQKAETAEDERQVLEVLFVQTGEAAQQRRGVDGELRAGGVAQVRVEAVVHGPRRPPPGHHDGRRGQGTPRERVPEELRVHQHRREEHQHLAQSSPAQNILSHRRSIGHPHGIFAGIVVLLVARTEYSQASSFFIPDCESGERSA
eukprot:689133-Pyramimonas_sp.AAC.1